ncbi:phosphoenolpyruvate--protein phosphotransferase [Vibrio sp. SCSIO 43136]|uniref:phosphoenolpyruvate--protein phosphotransferase n=1 Tax=Vibrio sp. SCSIO 43136 TaxID=2819101 RepID=UPI002074FB09|nr:phosphoenolpyruvate--protein phosphotransferase [Vibrio sp. SCSIO 43136]USD67717.1 phosphoenolpyruvate--protein phosphotransferase [Vibrio sp. SCSIO 43136]
MAGIVVVSHSRQLALGVAELATQMTQGKVRLAVAAGIDDPDNPIGTDAMAVMMAIEEVCDDQGVLILMDLGSALLSTEMALELIDDELREKVTLISAPLVEGTLAASVAASANLPMATIVEEANRALEAKREHLGDGEPQAPAASVSADEPSATAVTYTWTVQNPHGIHARPAATIVSALASLQANIWLKKGEQSASATSLNSIAKLGAVKGDEITFAVEGEESELAIKAIQSLCDQHFGEAELVANGADQESETEQPSAQQEIAGAIVGIAVSQGVVKAPAVKFESRMPEVPRRDYQGFEAESGRLSAAMDEVKAALSQQAKAPSGEVFQAHLLMLTDPELWHGLLAEVENQQIAEQAWLNTMGKLAEDYRNAQSQYMQEREADVWDIAKQVMQVLVGEKSSGVEFNEPSIVLARDLMPSDVAGLDKSKVLAICLSEGGKTSHSAIIARAMGIPAIVKAKGCLDQITDQQVITVDGEQGVIWIEPSEEKALELAQKREQWIAETQACQQAAMESAVTQSGVEVQVLANIGGPNDVASALENGCDGVGLFRTEFLFQDSAELPSEQDQYEVYLDIATRLEGKPLTIRSLDVGGDKPLAAYPMPEEENPFLGLRGVRLCLAHQKLFIDQIRAVLRAHAECNNIQLMIPMIATVEEVRQVKALVAEQAEQLGLDASAMKLGIMIEVPAAVLNADALALHVDFFSIGTNDLTQYVMAADRGNTEVAHLVDYFDEAVLKAIELTCEAGQKAGIPVSMCGEMAGDTKATSQLLDFGLTKFSASGSLLPKLKATIREL